MPRPLDHYGMDLSGYGRAYRGDSTGGGEPFATENGVIYAPKKGLFDKSIKYDKNGMPSPENRLGREMLARIQQQARLAGEKQTREKDILSLIAGQNLTAQEKAALAAKELALAQIGATNVANISYRDTSATEGSLRDKRAAEQPHLASMAQSSANRTNAENNAIGSTAMDTHKANIARLLAGNDVLKSQADAARLVNVGQYGTVVAGDKGRPSSTIAAGGNNLLSKTDPVTGAITQSVEASPNTIKDSLFNEFPPGGIPGVSLGVPAATTNTPPSGNPITTSAAPAYSLPVTQPLGAISNTPSAGVSAADFLKQLSGIAGNSTIQQAKLRNQFGIDAAHATGQFPSQIGSSVFKTNPNLLYNGEIRNQFDSLPTDQKQSVFNDVLRKLGIGVQGGYTPYTDPRVKGINRGMGVQPYDSQF